MNEKNNYYFCEKCGIVFASENFGPKSYHSCGTMCEKLDDDFNTNEIEHSVNDNDINPLNRAIARQKENEEKIKNISNMIITTTPSIEGYDIQEYLGLVSGEVMFKPSLLSSVKASVLNFLDSCSFSEKELSGSDEVMRKAREYADKKLRYAAYEKGANAVIGVDMETTIVDSIMQVTIYGTAVVVHKN